MSEQLIRLATRSQVMPRLGVRSSAEWGVSCGATSNSNVLHARYLGLLGNAHALGMTLIVAGSDISKTKRGLPGWQHQVTLL
jgi:hypothetical protein